MADIPNTQSSPPQASTSQPHTPDPDDPIPPAQTQDPTNTNSPTFIEDDDDLINVDDTDVPYTFVLDLGPEQNDDTIIQTPDLNSNPGGVDGLDGLTSVIERIDEISVVSSDISSEGDASVGVLEWEILLAVNNFERDLEYATEGFIYTPEFDTLIGQFVETVRGLRGSPPAAQSCIDNLPLVALKKDDLNEDNCVLCAVCRDEIIVAERVARLPCKHYYHGECIVPWLSIHNTCPVCRFELPTDDVDYERSKNRVDNNDNDDDNDDDHDDGELRVGYGFDLSP